jgi:hypothetical protein
MKKTPSHRSLILSAAVAAAIGAIAALAPTSFAQSRVGGDGRLMDASNRVGSGGLNDGSGAALPPGVLNNALVTGNVTGGVGFQGNIPYFSPGAFHGNLPGSFVDTFVSGSTNVTTGGTLINNAQNVHLYLGDNRGVNPPSNFISTGAQPGYIPAATSSDSQFSSDTRLAGSTITSPTSSLVPSSIFQTGGTQGGGGTSAYTSASPLFGVTSLQSQQQTNGTSQFNSAALSNASAQSALGTGDRIDQSADLKVPALSDSTAMNPDLSAGMGLSGLGTPPGVASFATPRTGSANGLNNGTPGQPGAQNSKAGFAAQSANSTAGNDNANSLNAGPLGGTGGNGTANGTGSISGQLASGAVNAAVPSGYPLGTRVGDRALADGINSGEGAYTNIYSPTSNLPGSKYSQMLLRLKTISPNTALSPEQRNLLNQAKLQDIRVAQAANGPSKSGETRTSPSGAIPRGSDLRTGLPGSGTGGATGGATGLMSPPGSSQGPSPIVPSAPIIPQQVAPVEKGKPVELNSFATDAATAQTKDELAKAEDLMKQGKFTAALEQYDLVEQQTPSNPFIQLGRANAELGASYYSLAVAHLRDAFMTDHALLSAQLDLRTFLGEDKLQYLVKDLKQIAQANPTQYKPVFLLAYICYNTNNARGAAAYLDLAEKREGKPDPFFQLLRQHWDLPDISGDTNNSDLNK